MPAHVQIAGQGVAQIVATHRGDGAPRQRLRQRVVAWRRAQCDLWSSWGFLMGIFNGIHTHDKIMCQGCGVTYIYIRLG